MHKDIFQYTVILKMRLWSLLTSNVLPPPPSLCADSQISTVASFKIAQREENGQNGACRNSIICYGADGEWYQWFNYLIWACDTHLVNIFSLSFNRHPSQSLQHVAVIIAMDSEVIINPVAEPTCTHLLTSLITYLGKAGSTNNAHTCTHSWRLWGG